MSRRTIKLDQTNIFLCSFITYFIYASIIERSDIGLLFSPEIRLFINILLIGITVGCLLFIFIFLQRYTLRSLMLILSILSIFLISVIVSDSKTVFFGYLFSICALRLDKRFFFKRFSRVHLFLCLFVILLYSMGFLRISTWVRDEEGTLRYSLGFVNPNTLGILTFEGICIFLYNRAGRIKKRHLLLCTVMTLASYFYSRSQTQLLVSVLLLCAFYMNEYIFKKYLKLPKKEQKRIVRIVAIIFVVLFITAFIYLWYNYKDVLDNDSLRIRFIVARDYVKYYGISLFGHRIIAYEELDSSHYHHAFDLGYISMLVKNGLLVTLITLGAFLHLLRKKIREGNYAISIILLCYALYFLMENAPANIAYNPFIVFFGELIPKTKKSKHIKQAHNILKENYESSTIWRLRTND